MREVVRLAAPHLWPHMTLGCMHCPWRHCRGQNGGARQAWPEPLLSHLLALWASILTENGEGNGSSSHRAIGELSEVQHLGLTKGSQQLLIPPLPTSTPLLSWKCYLKDNPKCIKEMYINLALTYTFLPVTLADIETVCDRGGTTG